MKTYKTQSEVEADIKDGWLIVNDDVTFECNIKIDANIKARGSKARVIDVMNIKAGDIDARDIDVRDINARDIKAGGIRARDISYYAACFAYNNITCRSIAPPPAGKTAGTLF